VIKKSIISNLKLFSISLTSFLILASVSLYAFAEDAPKSWADIKPDAAASDSGFPVLSVVGGLVLAGLLAFIIIRGRKPKKSGIAPPKKEAASAKVPKSERASSGKQGGGALDGLIVKMFGKKQAAPVIGVDITNESIIISQVKRTKTGIELEKLVSANTPQNAIRDGEIIDTGSIAQVIQELLEKNQITANRAITTVSGQAVIIRTIQFPSMSAKELKEVVLHEAERYIPFPIEDVNIDFQSLEEIEDEGINKVEVLLVAAQKQFINSYVETFIIAGLKLIGIDVASFAVARALTSSDASLGNGEPIVLVLIRGETTDINVFQNGVPKFSRSIPIGSTTFIETIASNLNISLEEAIQVFDKVVVPLAGQSVSDDPLVEMASNEIRTTLRELTTEIQRSLEYYQSQGSERVQQLILSGRGAKMRNLDKHLSMNLGVDVEISNPLNHIQFDEQAYPAEYLMDNAPIFVTSIGLARRGVEEF
jgi:type IV pilus assembly protein PilM